MDKRTEAREEYYAKMRELDPAHEPESLQPVERRYKVTGEAAVLGHQPGEEFDATLPFEQEDLFLEYGHLTVVEQQQESVPSEDTTPEEEEE